MGCMQTLSGRVFDYAKPHKSMIEIKDIANGLAMTCRYGGQCKRFYSVAEHSVLCYGAMVRETNNEMLHFWALMHDAAEAYCCDLPSGLKEMLPAYKKIEDRVLKVIADKYDLPWPVPAKIKEIDRRVLLAERPQVMKVPEIENAAWEPYSHIAPYPGIVLKHYYDDIGKNDFLEAFRHLFK